MKRLATIVISLIIFACSLCGRANSAQYYLDRSLELWYDAPAVDWLEALPLGNGRLGAMVFGGVAEERLQFNEATLWSGGPRDWNNPGAREMLPVIRKAVDDGKYEEAVNISKKMMGPTSQSYMPMGNLYMKFKDAGPATEYDRALNLYSAVATTRFKVNGALIEREVFVSYPDQVIVIRMKAEKPGVLTFDATLDSQLKFETAAAGRDTLVLTGKGPTFLAADYLTPKESIVYDPDGRKGMDFDIRVKAIARGGKVSADTNGLHVAGATEVMLLVSAATSFNGYDKEPGTQGINPVVASKQHLKAASKKTFEQLLARHEKDYGNLFRRVDLYLGKSPAGTAGLPTNKLIEQFGAKDPRLVELMYHYGRYLLISSSRPGGQPANLQGIWNDKLRPPWSSNYTTNINIEMNYWLAEPTNLAECAEPLVKMLEELAKTGAVTAKVNYGKRGWVVHHNTDLWRQSAPVGDYGETGNPVYALWMMGGAWMSTHLWEHYAFGQDKAYLKKEYPVMKGAAEFLLDWLVDDGDGHLVTNPCTSPEHFFTAPTIKKPSKATALVLKELNVGTGPRVSITKGCTMDQSIIREVFTNNIEASKALGVDAAFRDTLINARSKLLVPGITKSGLLMEWNQDFDDPEPQHIHFAHLFGVHPGHWITRATHPDLFDAAKKSMFARGDGGSGWAYAWRINMYARFGDADRAYLFISKLLHPTAEKVLYIPNTGGVYANLLDACPPYQIDGNFGFTAGVTEMLLQSHEGEINLLPALPFSNWPEGFVTGLHARGGYTVDIAWSEGRLSKAVIRAKVSGPCKVRAAVPVEVMSGGRPVKYTKDASGAVVFHAAAGGVYEIVGAAR